MKEKFYLLTLILSLTLYGQQPNYLAYLPMNFSIEDYSGQTFPIHSGMTGLNQAGIGRNNTPFSGLFFTGSDCVSLGRLPGLTNDLKHFTISFWDKAGTSNPTTHETIFKTLNNGSATSVGLDFYRAADLSFDPNSMQFEMRDEDGNSINFAIETSAMTDEE